MGAGYVRALRVGFLPSQSLSKGYQNNKKSKTVSLRVGFFTLPSQKMAESQKRKKIFLKFGEIFRKLRKIEENFRNQRKFFENRKNFC